MHLALKSDFLSEQIAGVSPTSVANRLSEIDWSFDQRSKAPDIESIHPYPAKFIGDIPRSFIENLSIPSGTVVLDPFCGSGTTLIEAQRAGLDAVGIDLNPIACLIARVKTSPLPQGFNETIIQVVQRAKAIKSLPSPNIPNVDHWFKPDVQVAVGALAHVIAMNEFRPWLDPLRLALSTILVRVSNQDSDTRYAAVGKSVDGNDVFSLFTSSASKLQQALNGRNWDLTATKIIEGNTLEIATSDIGVNVGLVITSPPYPNAYEYWLYHKYRMWWLGFDPIFVKENEIGARPHFFKKDPHTGETFIDQMRLTFDLIKGVLVNHGYVCFVVGRSKIHGKIFDNGEIIENVAKKAGFDVVTRFDRIIKSNRKSFNLSHANIKNETVLVFQKP